MPYPPYTERALAAHATGRVLVRCRITLYGETQDCAVLRGVPELTQGVLDWLGRTRFKPATFNGQPIAIIYLFSFNFSLP